MYIKYFNGTTSLQILRLNYSHKINSKQQTEKIRCIRQSNIVSNEK